MTTEALCPASQGILFFLCRSDSSPSHLPLSHSLCSRLLPTHTGCILVSVLPKQRVAPTYVVVSDVVTCTRVFKAVHRSDPCSLSTYSLSASCASSAAEGHRIDAVTHPWPPRASTLEGFFEYYFQCRARIGCTLQSLTITENCLRKRH